MSRLGPLEEEDERNCCVCGSEDGAAMECDGICSLNLEGSRGCGGQYASELEKMKHCVAGGARAMIYGWKDGRQEEERLAYQLRGSRGSWEKTRYSTGDEDIHFFFL
tara:strand:- start:310 stop:630 length:321 start_codon:yes stop_codon:yes gene_type:complete